MTTPLLPDQESDVPERGPESQQPQDNSFVVWVLRILSALVVPVVLMVFFFSFQFLKDDDVNKIVQVIVAVVVGVIGVWALYWGMDRLVNLLPEGPASGVRPFVFVGPALVFLSFYLVYPAINTTILAFRDRNGEGFVWFDNFVTLFTESQYLTGIRNNLLPVDRRWELFGMQASVGGSASVRGLNYRIGWPPILPVMGGPIQAMSTSIRVCIPSWNLEIYTR